MVILVFNSGSSSLKFRVFKIQASAELGLVLGGVISAFGDAASCRWFIGEDQDETRAPIHNHHEAAVWVLRWIERELAGDPIAAVGHRVVHGGETFSAPVVLTDAIIEKIEALSALAPIHNPIAVAVMRAGRAQLGTSVPMVGVFDTAFHHEIPEYARTYALPQDWNRNYRIRRFGFHGIAHRYMFERFIQLSGANTAASRVITFQLGNGCSVAAIRNGHSIDTSMGYTPLEGLIMSSRSGDLDPGLVLHLLTQCRLSVEELNTAINHRAGLLGLSGVSSDMRTLLALEADGHPGAALAIQAFCHRARKYLGAYLAILGGAEAVVFGGGIGEHANRIRARICADMEWCGLRIDAGANEQAHGIETRISETTSTCAAYVIPVNEELVIARETLKLLRAQSTA